MFVILLASFTTFAFDAFLAADGQISCKHGNIDLDSLSISDFQYMVMSCNIKYSQVMLHRVKHSLKHTSMCDKEG